MNREIHTRQAVTESLLCGILLLAAGCSQEKGRWEEVTTENTVSAFEAFLSEYPDGTLADSARLQIEAIHFEEATSANTIAAYEEFLERYPEGPFVDTAGSALEASHFAEVLIANTIEAYEEFLGRYPEGILADSAHLILDETYPPFSTERVLEIASISGLVGVGSCSFRPGNEPNTIIAIMDVAVPIVEQMTCLCCGETIEIDPNTEVPIDPFFITRFSSSGAWDGYQAMTIAMETEIPEDAKVFIVSGPDGSTLKKVGKGFLVVEGEARLLRES